MPTFTLNIESAISIAYSTPKTAVPDPTTPIAQSAFICQRGERDCAKNKHDCKKNKHDNWLFLYVSGA
jgi:hypothetical protein